MIQQAAVIGVIGIWLHYQTYGSQATTLTRRKPAAEASLQSPLLSNDDQRVDVTADEEEETGDQS
jgi:hypothetical protein